MCCLKKKKMDNFRSFYKERVILHSLENVRTEKDINIKYIYVENNLALIYYYLFDFVILL